MWLQTQDGVRLTHEAFYSIPLGRYQALKHVGMWKMKFLKKLKTFENAKNNFFVSLPKRITIGGSIRLTEIRRLANSYPVWTKTDDNPWGVPKRPFSEPGPFRPLH
jgi:hypothetical protein